AERCRRENPRPGNRAALTAARRARTAGSVRCSSAKRDSSSRAAPKRCSIWQLGVVRSRTRRRQKRASEISRGRLQRLPDSVRIHTGYGRERPCRCLTRRRGSRFEQRSRYERLLESDGDTAQRLDVVWSCAVCVVLLRAVVVMLSEIVVGLHFTEDDPGAG